jgi:hypothetical protein
MLHPVETSRATTVGVTPAKPVIPPPEANPWWWHPNRVGVGGPDDHWRTRLLEFDRDLAITWNRYTERWQVWMRKPSLVNKICWGWALLFIVRYSDGSYCPLDERIFARLYEASAAKWGNGRQYFSRIEAQLEYDKSRAEQKRKDAVGHSAGEFYTHTLPSVGYGTVNNGSKCVEYD